MRIAARFTSILVKIAIALALVEGLVRLVVLLGLVELPLAGVVAFDIFTRGVPVPAAERLMVADRNLIQRMRPGFAMAYNRRIRFEGRMATYLVRTNERGFRTPPFDEEKAPGVFRIVCLGDSSTFGLNVEQEDAYPQVLGRLLEERFPGRFEVLNLGVPGYTTRQGLELLRRQVVAVEPDLVTFAFGTNDQFFRGPLSDEAVIRFQQSTLGGVVLAFQGAVEHSHAFRLLRTVAARFVRRPSEAPGQGQTKPRVALDEIQAMIVAARALLEPAGSDLVVLNNDFFRTRARSALAAGAERAGADFLDMAALLDEARGERTRRLEVERRLPPATARDGTVLLRVRAPGESGLRVKVQKLGQGEKVIVLGDDGTEGDQVAGDDIWSGYVPGRAGTDVLRYSYLDEQGRSEFVDTSLVPSSRNRLAPASGIGDLDVFGEMEFFSDGSHPDERGHRRIAEALLEHLLANDRVRRFLQNRSAGRADG
jgi:lysophospholipase L1-like esterase